MCDIHYTKDGSTCYIIAYFINKNKKTCFSKSFNYYNSISPNKSAIENPVCVSGSS
ncbi:hypothetical protein LEQ41_06685 [Streptococcus agalactiae]|nr:hypothetical protein [Streptococcus agalactiae]